MRISDKEKECLMFSILRRMKRAELEPNFLKRKRNVRLWRKIETIYGKEMLSQLLNELQSSGIIEPHKETRILVVSQKGKEIYRRGWILYENHWYDADYVRKYTVIISVIALLVAIIGNETIGKAVKYIYVLLSR